MRENYEKSTQRIIVKVKNVKDGERRTAWRETVAISGINGINGIKAGWKLGRWHLAGSGMIHRRRGPDGGDSERAGGRS